MQCGRVRRWRLSSFVAELWATWIALSTAHGPVQVYCDNQAVVRNFHWLLHTGHIKSNWQCQDWWQAIHQVLTDRSQRHPCPFRISSIPAHCLEEFEPWQISPAQAHAAGTTIEHIVRNRQADRVAKECAARVAPIYPEIGANVVQAAKQHQGWLVRTHGLLDTTDCIHPSHQGPVQPTELRLTLADAQTTFPRGHGIAISDSTGGNPRFRCNTRHLNVGDIPWMIGRQSVSGLSNFGGDKRIHQVLPSAN